DENQDFLTGDTKTVVQRLFNEIAPKMSDRSSGFTRIIKTADYRIGDAGSIVILQLTSEGEKPKGTIRNAKGLRRKRYDKRIKFASDVMKARKETAKEKASPEAPKEEAT